MKNAGIWIDHKQAYIVIVDEDLIISEHIKSAVAGHVRFTSHTSSEDGAADDQRDSQFAVHLNKYYDEIIALLGDAEAVLVFGPGEAKREFETRLLSKGYDGHIPALETVDKMTEPQIVAKVKHHYHLITRVLEA